MRDLPSLLPQQGLSLVRGTRDQALSDATVFAVLARSAQRYPHRDAAIFTQAGWRCAAPGWSCCKRATSALRACKRWVCNRATGWAFGPPTGRSG